MKKTCIVLVMMVAAYACSQKTVAPASTPTAEAPPAAPATPAAPAADVNAAKIAEGKTVYVNRCGRCHALKPVDGYTAAQWQNILNSMIPKAKLDAVQGEHVTAYVMANAKKSS